mmetsp:Transcript_35337/g.59624  ORF Transcript_35337/g.59624 Transcript_35337/m.59624 type:complete len:208 (+) Transcript_35337:561-1184(+)
MSASALLLLCCWSRPPTPPSFSATAAAAAAAARGKGFERWSPVTCAYAAAALWPLPWWWCATLKKRSSRLVERHATPRGTPSLSRTTHSKLFTVNEGRRGRWGEDGGEGLPSWLPLPSASPSPSSSLSPPPAPSLSSSRVNTNTGAGLLVPKRATAAFPSELLTATATVATRTSKPVTSLSTRPPAALTEVAAAGSFDVVAAVEEAA